MKEKLLNMVWSTLLIMRQSVAESRGFSFMNSLSKLLQSLADFCKPRVSVSVKGQLCSKIYSSALLFTVTQMEPQKLLI